ncbi:serine hydrolase domain-containing protein [Planctomicrobium sp. SH664]|uniref:serine hydrolase domain-containing protein n=1 Tax=Planctomicrobium sp. SH664 TaxID=3448125 RepID=UPI003F5B5214
MSGGGRKSEWLLGQVTISSSHPSADNGTQFVWIIYNRACGGPGGDGRNGPTRPAHLIFERSESPMLRIRLVALLLLVVIGPATLLPAQEQQVAPFPGKDWPQATPAAMGLNISRLEQARDISLPGGGAGIIIRRGHQVFSWGDIAQLFDLKSSTKSYGTTALGMAILDGKVQLDDLAVKHHPRFGEQTLSRGGEEWFREVTLRQLATHTAGFEKPGGYSELFAKPGTVYMYSDCGPNWLAECLTLAYGRDLNELMFERIFTPIGITPQDLVWRKNAYRPEQIDGIVRREFGAGIHTNVSAMARLGYLYLRGGEWNGLRLLPADYVREAAHQPQLATLPMSERDARHGRANKHYGLLFWNNADGSRSGVPQDAYWAAGLYDSRIVIIPSLDLVIARAGQTIPGEIQGQAPIGEMVRLVVAAVESAE